MSQFARVIRLDESDLNIFQTAADIGEWAISGTFEFSNWTDTDLTGNKRQAFANGWFGLDSFGRSTLIAVSPITDAEFENLIDPLARHFIDNYGAPGMDAARPVARQELEQMRDMCEDHEPNTLFMIERVLEEVGVRERIRVIKPQDASLEAFAVHGT
ncbi:MAG: DUF6505 family protein [Alphaproteobacteria bacterium]